MHSGFDGIVRPNMSRMTDAVVRFPRLPKGLEKCIVEEGDIRARPGGWATSAGASGAAFMVSATADGMGSFTKCCPIPHKRAEIFVLICASDLDYVDILDF